MDIDQVLAGVERLITSIDEEAARAPFSRNQNDALPGTLQAGLEALDSLIERPKDAVADLRITPDGMTATLDVVPAAAGGHPLSADDVWSLLIQAGVVQGVLHDEVRRLVAEAERGSRPQEGVVVARGTPAVDSLPRRWAVLPELSPHKPEAGSALNQDFKAVSPFVVVRSGDLLARILPAREGAPGHDVFGTVLEFRPLNPPSPLPGANVRETEAGFVAGCDGSFRSDGGKFWVEPVLQLDSGVGYATGHIDFVGDIHIRGEIAAGFRIHAGGSVFSDRVIDATELVSGGDVVTPLGIIGREGAVVRAEGRVRAKFLENVFVLSRGPIEIHGSVANCVLQTLDRLVMGPRGLVQGGRIQAQNGVDVFRIGSERGAKAEVVCGMDFSVLDKVCWARDQTMSLVKQMKTLEAYRRSHPERGPALDEALARLREQVRKLSELSRELVGNVDRNEEAAVTVRGTVFPGTYIEICHVTFVVTRPLERVRFVLDKRHGQIQAAPL